MQVALFYFPRQFHIGKCSVPIGALFLYIQGQYATIKIRKGEIKKC
jgi:hypothetical protein